MAHNPLSDDDLAATPAACVEKRLLDSLDQLYEPTSRQSSAGCAALAGPGAEVEDLVHDVFWSPCERKNEFRRRRQDLDLAVSHHRLIVRKRRFRRRLHSFLGLAFREQHNHAHAQQPDRRSKNWSAASSARCCTRLGSPA